MDYSDPAVSVMVTFTDLAYRRLRFSLENFPLALCPSFLVGKEGKTAHSGRTKKGDIHRQPLLG